VCLKPGWKLRCFGRLVVFWTRKVCAYCKLYPHQIMNAKKRKRVSVDRLLCAGTCAAAGCDEEVWVRVPASDFPLANAHYATILATRDIVFCEKCHAKSQALDPPLNMFTCHINGTVVHFSNHPSFLPISPYVSVPAPTAANAVTTTTTTATNSGIPVADAASLSLLYQQAANLILHSSFVLVVAGAGMSADSFNGATFRGNSGSGIGSGVTLGGHLPLEEVDYATNAPAGA